MRFFLDSNILLYLTDKVAHEKQKIASFLVAKATEEANGFISFQVIQECLNCLNKKDNKEVDYDYKSTFLNEVLSPICGLFSADEDLYSNALRISERWQYSFYDSLIIAAALRLECDILYSEDLQHGQKVENLKIVNPFRKK